MDALICHCDDNVATAVRDLAVGERAQVSGGGHEGAVELKSAIPLGHKFALRDIPGGREVIKYGETVGVATSAIRRGEHVHLHNVEGLRGRGDLR